MSYAKKNLRKVEDQALKHGLSNTQEARFPRADLRAEQTGIKAGPDGLEVLIFVHVSRETEKLFRTFWGSSR